MTTMRSWRSTGRREHNRSEACADVSERRWASLPGARAREGRRPRRHKRGGIRRRFKKSGWTYDS
eukprot:2497032-Pyramimonas_sp.AAC.1